MPMSEHRDRPNVGGGSGVGHNIYTIASYTLQTWHTFAALIVISDYFLYLTL